MTPPPIRPNKVPIKPMMRPSIINIFIIFLAVAPMDFKMAISFLFSITIMIRVLMMLKAATKTISTKMMNMTTFSSLSAEKKFL